MQSENTKCGRRPPSMRKMRCYDEGATRDQVAARVLLLDEKSSEHTVTSFEDHIQKMTTDFSKVF